MGVEMLFYSIAFAKFVRLRFGIFMFNVKLSDAQAKLIFVGCCFLAEEVAGDYNYLGLK